MKLIGLNKAIEVRQGAITRTIKELEDLALSLGIELPQERYGKREVIKLLQDYYWNQKNPGQPKPQFEDPMLIKSLKDLPQAEQEQIWESPDWAIEKKRNGIRCVGYLGANSIFTSRNESLEDFMPSQLTSQLFWLQTDMADYEGTVVDGEVISTKKSVSTEGFTQSGKGTVSKNVLQAVGQLLNMERSVEAQQANGLPLMYILYDVMQYKGEDIKKVPYEERRLYLEEVFTAWQNRLPDGSKLELNGTLDTDKRAFFEQCIAEGGEGCVLKYKQGVYKPGPTRTKEQLKVKTQFEIDAVVTGAIPPKSGRLLKEGLVGGLLFSAKDMNTGEWHEVAGVSSLDWGFRREITIKNPDGTFKGIKPEVMGRVAEIEGMEWTKTARISHARITRWRDVGADAKSADEAVFDRAAVLRELEEKAGSA